MKVRLVIALLLVAALSRLLPHPPNFTPIAAIGLFGAAFLQKRHMAFIVPFGALFLSDLILNNIIYAQFYSGFVWFTSLWLYLAFALVILIGQAILRAGTSPARILTASLSASTVFFLVSNFHSWYSFPTYPKTWDGLLSCYTAALPFFGNTLLGDLCYSAVLFGAYAWVVNSRFFRQTA